MTLSAAAEPLTSRQKTIAVWLAIVCAATRFLAMARSPWDWDEVLFVLAMREYDVSLHHPHPPGFPVYIGAARLVRLVIEDDFRALQALNLLAAVLIFPALFFFARELRFRFRTSAIAATLFAFLPNVWFFGGTAFSDVPSIVLVLFAVTLLLRGTRSRNAYWGGTLLLALAIGIRPQNLLIGLVPGILATRRRRPYEVLVALLIGIAVVATAYGAAMNATGSSDDFLRVIREHADYISRVDSWKSEARPPLWRITDRFFVKQYQSPVLSIIATIFALVSVAGSIRQRSRPMLLNVATFAPFAISAWLMLDRFSISRFSIGYQPMFAILVADGIRRTAESIAAGFGRDRRPGERIHAAEKTPASFLRIELTLAALTIGGLVAYALPAFRAVRSEVAPSVLAAEAVNVRVDPARERLYVGHTMSKFVDLCAPGVPYTRVIDDRALPLSRVESAWLLAEITTTPAEGLVFRRERGNLWNIARRLYFEVKLAPLEKRAQFVSGWSEPEREGIHEWRAMGARSLTELPPATGETKLRMHLDMPTELAQQNPRIVVTVNGRVVGDFRTTETYFERNYNLMPAPLGSPNVLELSVDRTLPAARPGITPDRRRLGLRLRYLAWGPS